MRTITQAVGAIVLLFYVLSWLDIVDFRLCVGKPGACRDMSIPSDQPKRELRT